jgi:hypothetical protein
MTEEKIKKVKVEKKHVALKCLATSNGQVKKGEEFTCNDKELAIFKKHKAV